MIAVDSAVLAVLECGVEHHHAKNSPEYAERMRVLRDAIDDELGVHEPPREGPTLNPTGVNQHTDRSFDISNDLPNVLERTGGGTSRNYTIARLKRDNPDLAEQVISGEISAAYLDTSLKLLTVWIGNLGQFDIKSR